MTNAWLKIQRAINLHLIDYPSVGIVSPLTPTLAASPVISFSWTAGVNNIFNYGLFVDTITENYLKQVTILDVINQADNIAKAAAASGKLNLTVQELLSLALLNQAAFDAQSQEVRTL